MMVALVGYAQSGKNTAAEGLIVHKGFFQAAFADRLKILTEKALLKFGIKVDLINDEKEKKRWRDLLVAFGAGMRNNIDQDYWVKQLMVTLRTSRMSHKNVVITDCRYLSEVKWVQAQGGKVVYIDRPGTKPANTEECQSIAAVLSMTPNIGWITNDKTIGTLQKRLIRLVVPRRGRSDVAHNT